VASPTNSPVRRQNARPGSIPPAGAPPSASAQNGQQVLSRKKRK